MKHSFFLLFLLLISCQTKEFDKVLSEFTDQSFLFVTDSLILEEYDILSAHTILKKSNSYIFANNPKYNHFTYLDSSYKKIEFIEVGQGPSEAIRAIILQNNNDSLFAFFDQVKKEIYSINIADVRNECIHPSKLVSINTNDKITNLIETVDYYIGAGIIFGDRFLLLNKKNNHISYGGDYPNLECLIPLNNIQKGAVFSSSYMVSHPIKNKFAFFKNGILEIYNISESNLEKTYSKYAFSPSFDIGSDSGPMYIYNKNNTVGYYVGVADEAYIYILYSHQNFDQKDRLNAYNCHYLLKYDWNGTPVKKMELEKPLRSIDIYCNVLYGISIEKDPILYIYDL